jgi:glutaredoxin
MIEIWQAEWCPFSAQLRERLTERGVDFVAHQVAPDRGRRDAMRQEVGTDEIPAVRLDDGEVLTGDTDAMLARVDELFPPTPETEGHRQMDAAH